MAQRAAAGRPTRPAGGPDGDPEGRGGQRGLRLLSSHQCDLALDQLAAHFTCGLLCRPGSCLGRVERRLQLVVGLLRRTDQVA